MAGFEANVRGGVRCVFGSVGLVFFNMIIYKFENISISLFSRSFMSCVLS